MAKKDRILLRLYVVTWYRYTPDDERSDWTETKTGRRVSVFSGAMQGSSIGDIEKILFEDVVPQFDPFKITVAPTGFISAGQTKEVSHEKVMVYERNTNNTEATEDERKAERG